LTPEETARRAAWDGAVTPEELRRRTTAQLGNWETRKGDYRTLYPSLHFRYEFTKGLLGRASWSTGITRPGFGNIIPNDTIDDTTTTIVTSNPSLKPQFANSFDLSLEYYFEPAGMISVGAFDKEMTDFILTLSGLTVPVGPDNGFNGDYAGYTLTMPVNGGKARVNGVEVAYQQQFSFLPGFWRGFGFYGNFTWLKSSGDFGNYGRAGSLPDFSPRSGSGGLSYSDYGWNFRLLGTYQSKNATGFNANPGAQLYSAARWNVDLLSSYIINKNLSVFCDLRNLTNEHGGRISQYTYPRQFQRFSTEITFGVSGRF
jgi:TonB-dependent receptor